MIPRQVPSRQVTRARRRISPIVSEAGLTGPTEELANAHPVHLAKIWIERHG
jgi:hypothetical protein